MPRSHLAAASLKRCHNTRNNLNDRKTDSSNDVQIRVPEVLMKQSFVLRWARTGLDREAFFQQHAG
jgi:hypothetical protein